MILFKLSHFLLQNMSSRYKLTNVPGQTHSPHFDVCCFFVYKVPTCQSVPRLKEYEKQEFDACLNSANDNFNDII